jgi:CheY-like chemotaxis protein
LTGPLSTDSDLDFVTPLASTSNLGKSPSMRPTYISLPERAISYFPPSSNVFTSTGVHRALTQSSSPDPSLHLDSPLNALVVDDDFITRQLMSRLLTRLGASVTCAENGAVALDLILGNANTPTSPNDKPANIPTASNDKTVNTPTSNYKAANEAWTPQAGQPRFDIVFLDNQMVNI